ncbi:MAG TPA: DivIVA domain-containing protein [Candidatus Eisenbacteria bacterium]|nr:DivIVA domain-containing protein [Candidatus Eisenbacteria bacterium]
MSRRTDRFPRVGRLRRGYHRRQVDRFIHRVEVSLQGVLPPVSAAEIRRAGFELVHGGYDVAAVDAALDQLEERSMTAAAAGRRERFDPGSEAAALREEVAAPYMRRFPRAAALRRGYDIDAVDDFLDRIADALAGQQVLAVEQIRSAAFPPRRGGYDEDAVDELLDRVVELMLVTHGTPDPATTPPPPARTDPGLAPPVY